MRKNHIKGIGVSLALLSLTACTSVPNDGGVYYVQDLIDEMIGTDNKASVIDPENALTDEEVNNMLARPLSLADAEMISMQVNPMAKTGILQVGIAEADYAQAGRLENPGFSYERMSGEEYSSTLLFDIGGLFLMPLKRDIEERRLERARYEAAGSVINHLAETRRAWINAVAEKQQTLLMERALESAETSNTLTRQMSALGHSGVIEAAESEMFLSDMQTALSRQRLAEDTAREVLIQQLGLWGNRARALTLPVELPNLPELPLEIESVEGEAIENRIDVQVAKANLESMAKSMDLTQMSPFLTAIEFGPVWEKAEGERESGYELELRIPIFDAGGVQNDKARFMFEQAQAQAQAVAIAAASNARTALSIYRINWEIAKHYEDTLLPIRQRISEEQLLMYNGMLISVFDLLEDVRDATDLQSAYVNAIRDFWLADTNLQQALTGSGSTPITIASASAIPGGGGAEEGH
ncbi:MAG: TolC family protein [Gammaproteobacteria bacterium]|nr:TolC family protein [Gammaproteobacteria bacterium]